MDLVLDISVHTVTNFVALLPIVMQWVATQGVRTLDVWTDGASNFKSHHIVSAVYQGNACKWGLEENGVFVRSWNYSESGEGKGPVDVHFSYLNMFVRLRLDSGHNVTTPDEYYLALTRGEKADRCMANTTTKLVKVAAPTMPVR